MLWQILVILLIIWIVIRKWKSRKMMEVFGQLESDTLALPFIGHAYKFFGNDEDVMNGLKHFGREAIEKGGIAPLTIGGYVGVVLADPVLLDYVAKTFIAKSEFVKFVRFLTGDGSIFAPVPIWRPRRKNLAPTFSPRYLTQFVRIFAEQSEIMTERLRSMADAGPFSLWTYMTTYTMDAVCESTLGTSVNAQQSNDHPFIKAFEKCMVYLTYRMASPWLHNDFVYGLLPSCRDFLKHKKVLYDFTKQVIETKRLENKSEDINKNDIKDDKNKSLRTFLDLLMDSYNSEHNMELQEETLVLLMAGTDTSAVGAAFTAVMLSTHPEYQDKIYEELKEVFGNSDRPVEAEDLPRLKYLDAAIKETLRLYPPVPGIVREIDRDCTLPSGAKLAKGFVVVVNIWALHRNHHYWGDDAELFRPERFLDGATALHHPAQFTPFSYGPRNCLGYKYAMMSMTTALATLLRSYRLLPATDAGCDPDAPLRIKFSVMMKHVDNYTVRLESRPKL